MAPAIFAHQTNCSINEGRMRSHETLIWLPSHTHTQLLVGFAGRLRRSFGRDDGMMGGRGTTTPTSRQPAGPNIY